MVVHHASTLAGRRTVHLMVDDEGVERGPMIRTSGPSFIVDRSGPTPRRVTDQARQRDGLPSAIDGDDSLLARFQRLHPDRRAVAVTGCGNLGMNAGVLASVGGPTFGVEGPAGSALLVRDGEHGRMAAQNEPPLDGGFRIGGPLLVADGQPSPLCAETFADPRHLLLFPYVSVGQQDRMDFGLTRLLHDPALYQAAVDGGVIRVALEEELPESDAVSASLVPHPVDPAELRSALAVKGYCETTTVSERGTCRFIDDTLELAFLRGIYPHHVLALDETGAVHSLLISGLSNRSGVQLDELAEDLCTAGFTEALLMDNGGDVGLWLPQEDRFTLRPAEPDRSARWPLTACFVYSEDSRR